MVSSIRPMDPRVAVQVEKLQRERWIAIAKMVALVAALIILVAVTTALVAPTPFSLYLVPLSVLFVVHCALPTAVYIKITLPKVRALEAQIAALSHTSLNIASNTCNSSSRLR